MLNHRSQVNPRRPVLTVAACLLGGCAAEPGQPAPIAAIASPLAFSCAEATVDLAGDFLDILSSTEPLDPRQPQAYGSELCSGFVFEFTNPDDEPLHGAYVHAGGASSRDGDELSQAECSNRRLEADFWGFSDRRWSRLATASAPGRFEPGTLPDTGYCKLEAQLDHSGSYETLRVIAAVTQDGRHYPMLALLW